MKHRLQAYWHKHHELISIAITTFFLLAGVVQYAFGLRYVLSMTALAIGIMAAITLIYWQVSARTKVALFISAFTVGMLVEIIGVNTGLLFGNYTYGATLGLKLAGVPLLIGVTWAYVSIAAWQIVSFSSFGSLAKILLGAGVIVMFDLVLEQFATAFGLWQWEGGVIPLKNYATWFAVSVTLLAIYAKYANQSKPSLYGAIGLPLTALFFWLMLLVR